MGKNLAVFWDSCFSPRSFWIKNAKIDCFCEKKNDFEDIFDQFEVHVVTVWSSRLGKTLKKNPFLAYGRFFTHF